MKNNIFKSFRFEIIVCSLLSLLYTLLTEAAIGALLFGVKTMVDDITGSKNVNIVGYSRNVPGGLPPEAVYGGIPESSGHMGTIALVAVFSIFLGITLFITYFLLLTKKFANYLGEIAVGINKIAEGNFDTRISIKNEDEFALIASRLNKMADDIQKIMQNERKNEYVKNDLITSVAHDLRTPLTSIIGYLDLVSGNRNLSQETKDKYISIAYDKSKRLEKLIEDLFAYTKYSSQETVMNFAQFDIVKFMEQLVDEFYPSFQEAELEYEFKTGAVSSIIMADGDLLFRAFANLIGNAVKYGRDGKSIKIQLTDKVEEVVISITNYGELIPEKDLESIFERFYRVENSRSRETGGSGLGLAIAKNIILRHKGTIQVTSDFNGTVFEVRLNKNLVIEKKEVEPKDGRK